jgi:hypothetical protein
MGTRHLIAVVVDDEMKVAQYGQWDGYLDGQGRDVVKFLTKLSSLARFKEQVRQCTFIDDEEVEKRWKSVGAKDGMATMDQSAKFNETWPELHRDTGAKILDLIMAKPRGLTDSSSFAADSLFCEFAYVIDLDNGELEIYGGFVTEGHAEGRFSKLSVDQEHRGDKKYYPVKPSAVLKIADLPKAFDDYEAKCTAEREAEE